MVSWLVLFMKFNAVKKSYSFVKQRLRLTKMFRAGKDTFDFFEKDILSNVSAYFLYLL